MNQILSVEMPNGKKRKNKSSIKSIVIVFALILIIFGIGIASTGVYAHYKRKTDNSKNNIKVSSSTKPIITIERTDANSINIVVTHDKEITMLKYTINEEEKQIKGDGKNKIQIEEKLPSGNSTIKVTAQDVNGISASYESKFEAEDKPEITLKQVENKIQVNVESKTNIATVSYYWDEDEQNATTENINDIKAEKIIDVLEGTHTLCVKAIDENGTESIKKQKLIGDTKPKLEIGTDGNAFIILAEDDEELSKIEIKFNSNEPIIEEINNKEYHKEIELTNGVNKLTVKVYNKNGLSETSKVKYTKE